VLDLTIIYYTANHLPIRFAKWTRRILVESAGDYPIISVSHKPMKFTENVCVGRIGRSTYNIYRQILIGAKAAKTEYVAMAEDDVLYPREHFTEFRPKEDEFAYNHNKWALYTWNPVYSRKKNRSVMHQLIAPRNLLIEALEERFEKYPDKNDYPEKYWGEIGKYENGLGVTVRKQSRFFSTKPCVVFCHPHAVGYSRLGNRKKLGKEQVSELEPWGKAEDVVKMYG